MNKTADFEKKKELLARLMAGKGFGVPREVPLAPRERPLTGLPLSFAQRRLWFLQQMELGDSLYNLPLLLRFNGPLEVGLLARSLNEMVRRHEVLRTCFEDREGEAVQCILPTLELPLPLTSLLPLSTAEREGELRRLVGEEVRRPFDLATAPLLRCHLYELAPTEHLLLVTMHHIISDGWSMGIFCRELTALYDAFRHARPSPLPPLPLQYADFTLWQRDWLAGEELERQLGYWREQLADVAPLELPIARPRPAVQRYDGAWQSFSLPQELVQRLQDLAQQEGASLFMVLLAAFQLLLYRYSGQADVPVGTPIANRNRAEIEGLIGFFVNTLVMRARIEGQGSFRHLLQQVREVALEAYAHQELPFERLVAELQPDRSLSHSPLFQVMFILQNSPAPLVGLPGLSVRRDEVPYECAPALFDLTITIEETEAGLAGVLLYNRDLFDPSVIGRLLDHYRLLLETIVAAPEQPVDRLSFLPDQERQQLAAWGRRRRAYPIERPVHEQFEAQVARTPEGCALEFEGQRFSYRELNERANRLAHRLRERGVRPETIVALFLDRSPELVVGMLAIWKAGGTCLPLDPAYPTERLAYMLEDSGARLLVAHPALVEQLPARRPPFLYVEDGEEAGTAPSRFTGGKLSQLAYVIYTSGSTGRPKGVLVDHKALAEHCREIQQQYRLSARDRVLHFASFSFDVSLEQLLPPLLCGASVVMRPTDLWEPVEAAHRIAGLGLTVANFPTAYWHRLTEAWSETRESLPENQLRLVIAGGEAMHVDALRLWRRSFMADVPLLNAYGPTENTITSALYETPTSLNEVDTLQRVPIGRPLANRTMYILDPAGNPVPVGVPGELYIGGAGVARGYLQRPALTAERFLPDPFGEEPGGRLYRTGDLARWRADGTIDFLGRLDEQVKVRGFRIELGEIEAALREHPAISESIVLLREDGAADPCLVAYYVVAAGTQPPGSDRLREYLAGRLPAYMVPAALIPLDALPLLPNGKVDRRALPAPEQGQPEGGSGLDLPRTPVEEILVDIWATLLGRERVGIRENFFELGGHSLKATQLISRVRDLFQVMLPMRGLFEAPTVEGMAAQIERLRRDDEEMWETLLPVPREGALPLSFAQERLWLLDRLEPGNPAYNLPTLLRLRGPLDLLVLQRALTEIVRRHEVLRTVFRMEGERPVQLILSPEVVELPLVELDAPLAAEREMQASRLVLEEVERPFDLARGPLLRARVVRLEPEHHVLVVTVHHIAFDGWSVALFTQELATLYEAFRQGAPSPLPEPTIQYADFAIWQRQWLSESRQATQLDYWREQLADLPPLIELPADRIRPATPKYRSGVTSLKLEHELLVAVRQLSRQEGVTLFMTLLAAFKLLLYRLSGQTDIAVGTPVAGRNRSEIERVMGLFLNTLVLRNDLTGDPSFRSLLHRVRDVALDAYAHQEVPFERLLELLQPERSLSHSPLFQIFFNMFNLPEQASTLGDLTLEPFPLAEIQAKFDLTLYVEEQAGTLELTAVYNADLFAAERISEMLQQFRELLLQVIEEPAAPISTFSLLTPATRDRLPDPIRPLDARWEGPVYAPLADHARRFPERIAVRDPAGTLTYGELESLTNRLANRLLADGLRPGEVVAIYAHRSIPLVPTVLAILKAGAAFLILDPTYPAARLATLLGLARPRAWIQMAAAGELPVMVSEQLDQLPLNCRLVLPARLASTFLAEQPATPPAVTVGPDDLACIGFTSGSTGQPKGICGRHSSLSHFLPWLQEKFELDEEDRFSMLSGLAHDPLQRDIFIPLWIGATLCIPDPEEVGTPGWLADWMRREEITVANLTPAMEQLITMTAGGVELPSLRHAFFVGEALTQANVTRLTAIAPSLHCTNLYGSTESQRAISYYEVPRERGTGTLPIIPVGRGVPNTQLLLFNGAGQQAGVGELGEIYIRSPQLALGYLDDKALTQERFIPNPFTSDVRDRLYRTGDLGRYLPDGSVTIVGRNDAQVQIRGFRVEPGEIEALLLQHEALHAAVVVARESERVPGTLSLVAYVVPAWEPAPTEEELRRYLRRHLPDYMIPSHFLLLTALPISPNGKVDRAALPAPEEAATGRRQERVLPRTATEEVLGEIWLEVLGATEIGVHDDFFSLGGHSLLATQVVARIVDAFDVALPLRTLFESPTVAELAAAIEALILEEIAALDDETAQDLLMSDH